MVDSSSANRRPAIDGGPAMNVILLMSDTFRRDHLAAYGAPAPWERPGHASEPFIATPNLDRLAAESALFERFYLTHL